MIYDYYCDRCQRAKDIIKPVSEYNTYEYCDCGFEMRKLFSVQKAIIDKIDAQFCPALGQVVKSNAERRQLAKERGLQEVGNEPAESLHKHFLKRGLCLVSRKIGFLYRKQR